MKLNQPLIAIISVLFIILVTSCVQDTQPKEIHVKLDMRGVNNMSEVGIRGQSPLSWDETTYLNDKDNDSIYEGSFNIDTANHQIEFKFVNLNDQFELEDQKNRILDFEYKPETILIEAIFNNPDTKITKTLKK